MNAAHIEIARLKAIRIFGEALDKEYDQWSEDEKKACAMLDFIWKCEHGIQNADEDEYLKDAQSLVAMQDSSEMKRWMREIKAMGGEWKQSREKDSSSFLTNIYDSVSKFWNTVKEKMGWKKKDLISPFDGIRILKIANSASMDNFEKTRREITDGLKQEKIFDEIKKPDVEAKWRGVPSNIREKYQKEFHLIERKRERALDAAKSPEEAWKIAREFDEKSKAAKERLASEMITINPISQPAFDRIYSGGELSKSVYTKVFLGALGRPYSTWSKAEKEACSVLDAIWRRERGMETLDSDERTSDRLRKLSGKILKMSRAEIEIFNESLENLSQKNEGMSALLAHRKLMNTTQLCAGSLFDLKKDNLSSPFEIIRSIRIMNDPAIDLEDAALETQGYAMGFGSGSLADYRSSIRPAKGTEKIFGDKPYRVFESRAFSKFMANPDESSKVQPVEIKIQGLAGNVFIRCMSNEPQAIMDGFLMSVGQDKVTQLQCRNVANILLNSMDAGNGAYQRYLSDQNVNIAFADCRMGIDKLFSAPSSSPAQKNKAAVSPKAESVDSADTDKTSTAEAGNAESEKNTGLENEKVTIQKDSDGVEVVIVEGEDDEENYNWMPTM